MPRLLKLLRLTVSGMFDLSFFFIAIVNLRFYRGVNTCSMFVTTPPNASTSIMALALVVLFADVAA